jgi:YbgC/YbaW family acyl-CoA thioester hydrolase
VAVFSREHVVRFHEVDRAGIVYFARVFEWCHVVYEELLRELFGGVEPIFAVKDWGTPLVRAEADYRRPFRLDERITIEVAIGRVGRGSLEYVYELRGPDGESRATARLRHAFVGTDWRPRAAPDELLEGLRRLGLLPAPSGPATSSPAGPAPRADAR